MDKQENLKDKKEKDKTQELKQSCINLKIQIL